MARQSGRSRTARTVAIAVVAGVAVCVGVLALAAYQRANPTLPEQTAEAVPTFSLGVQTATPTPTPLPEPPFVRETERFLAVGAGTLWRAVAGACGEAEPLVERSTDGGRSWIDVTPRYIGIVQVASLDGFAVDAVEGVAAADSTCAPQVLRSWTNGEFWEAVPDQLAVSRYVDLIRPAIVHLDTGPVAAPCSGAHGLRALRQTVTLICGHVAYVWRDAQWAALPGSEAVAVAIEGTDVISVHVATGCAGFTLTRFRGGDPAAGTAAGCAGVTDAAASVAVVATGGGILVWSGDQFATAIGP